MKEKYKEYACRYYHNGSWWALSIYAADWADAEARISKLGNLELSGEISGRIRASFPGSGILVRFIVWLRNFTGL